MDWQALNVSLLLAGLTALILTPVGVFIARKLAWSRFAGRNFIQALIALPLILPPTVLGFYLMISLGELSPLGRFYQGITDESLVFSFEGILLASIIFNIPFAVQPVQRSFESIPLNVREAAWCSGLSGWQTFWRIELPLAWPGIVSAGILTIAHTLGEFGVVLMVGGNLAGETRTVAIAIYDRVQAFDNTGAATMSAALLMISLLSITLIYFLTDRAGHHERR
ncbi:MAG: molybdate ABC transporter permease subunit [Gammaproteobacteria bacterium]|nr:molybdate ABC transporter permease subunit [Gammaproteobacteria bacterium]